MANKLQKYNYKAANKRLKANLFDMVDQRDMALADARQLRAELQGVEDELKWEQDKRNTLHAELKSMTNMKDAALASWSGAMKGWQSDRAELALIKPPWSIVPDCWKWRAWNVSGGGTWFIDKPTIKRVNGVTVGWVSKSGSSHVYLNDWKDTLESRPLEEANE